MKIFSIPEKGFFVLLILLVLCCLNLFRYKIKKTNQNSFFIFESNRDFVHSISTILLRGIQKSGLG